MENYITLLSTCARDLVSQVASGTTSKTSPPKGGVYKYKTILALFAVVLSSSFGFGQSPGGVSSPPANTVNGVNYTLYSGYDSSVTDAGGGISGTILNTGVINTLVNPDDVVLDEIANNFSLKLTTNLKITTAGNYLFQFLSGETQTYLKVNGVEVITTAGAGTHASGNVALVAGVNTIEVRFSQRSVFLG